MAVDHIEMALVDGDIDGLADRAARMMQARRHIGELHEIAEILDRRVTPPAIEIAHERRPVDRREHRGVAADLHAALGVAGMLGEYLGRRRDQRAGQAAGQAHAYPLHVGAGVAPYGEGLFVVMEIDADLRQDDFGVVLDNLEALEGEHLGERNAP